MTSPDFADPNKYGSRINLKDFREFLVEVKDPRLGQYLKVESNITLEDLREAQKKIKEHKLRESSALKKILGLIFFGAIEPNLKLTPKRLVWILTHLDQIAPLMPESFAKKLILLLDQLAETVYKNL